MIILHEIDVDNQQHRARGGFYGVPPPFARHDAVLTENGVGIVEKQRRATLARNERFQPPPARQVRRSKSHLTVGQGEFKSAPPEALSENRLGALYG